MQRRQFVALAGAGISFSLAGCSSLLTGGGVTSGSNRTAKAEIIESKLFEIPAEKSPDYFLRTQIKNTGDVTIDLLPTTMKLYSDDGSIIEKEYYGISDLKQGEIFENSIFYDRKRENGERDSPVKGSVKFGELLSSSVNNTQPSGVNISNIDFKPGKDAALSAHITNTSDKPFKASVTVKFLSKQDYVLATPTGSTRLDPGETQAFTLGGTVPYLEYERKTTDYEILIEI